MKFLKWLGFIRTKRDSNYCDWPTASAPPRVSRTILPNEYVNRIKGDERIYSQTIIKV